MRDNFKELCETYIDLQSTVDRINRLPEEKKTNKFLAILEMHNVLYCIIKGKIFHTLDRADLPYKDRENLREQIILLEKEGVPKENINIMELISGDDLHELMKEQLEIEEKIGMKRQGREFLEDEFSK
jgi:hypothetical protein